MKVKLDKLTLENFKLFNQLTIEFRPITILTGANSSGKSSVLNALASILQTQSPSFFPFEYNPNGKNCHLGNFRDIVSRNNTKSTFKIEMSLSDGKSTYEIGAEYRYSSIGEHILPKQISYKEDDNVLKLNWKGSRLGGYEFMFENPKTADGNLQAMIVRIFSAFEEGESKTADETRSKSKISENSLSEEILKDFSEQKDASGKWQEIGTKTISEIQDTLKQKIFTRTLYSDLLKVVEEFQKKFIGLTQSA